MKTRRVNIESETLLCSRCRIEKPTSCFNERAMPSGPSYYSHCKECGLAMNRESYARHAARIAALRKQRYGADPEYKDRQSKNTKRYYRNNREKCLQQGKDAKVRDRDHNRVREKWSHLKREYGLTKEAYEEMLSTQGGACAICGGTAIGSPHGDSLYVDHCHKSGAVRGLLCHRCNAGLGFFKDDPDKVLNAAEYLMKLRSTQEEKLDEAA